MSKTKIIVAILVILGLAFFFSRRSPRHPQVDNSPVAAPSVSVTTTPTDPRVQDIPAGETQPPAIQKWREALAKAGFKLVRPKVPNAKDLPEFKNQKDAEEENKRIRAELQETNGTIISPNRQDGIPILPISATTMKCDIFSRQVFTAYVKVGANGAIEAMAPQKPSESLPVQELSQCRFVPKDPRIKAFKMILWSGRRILKSTPIAPRSRNTKTP